MPSNTNLSINTLADLVDKIAYFDGDHKTAISTLMVYRRSSVTAPMPTIYGLGLALTVQGVKRATLGNEVFDYAPGQSLVTSLDLPVVSHVTKANSTTPYLGMCLALDARILAQVAADMDFPTTVKEASTRALSVVALDDGLLDALIRLLRLLDEPALIPQLAPLVQREIAVRLLNGEHGSTLRHLITLGSSCQRIANTISWIRQTFSKNLPVDDLAAKAHMSPSTFRQHFRTVTGMSPLQYVKHMRLQEARQLMMNNGLDAGSAAVRVGYESASQFSREYSRLFGQPPHRDIHQMKIKTSDDQVFY
jgi:AraC-like DNA-binding protein